MPIPGTLTMEVYNPGIADDPPTIVNHITAECAVDIQNREVILKLPPKDTMPGGGKIRITQVLNYAYGTATDAGTQSIFQSAFLGATDGIRELFIKDETIPSSTECTARAESELAKVVGIPFELSFKTDYPGFKPLQVLHFTDSATSVSVYLLISEVSLTIESTKGTVSRIVYDVKASSYPKETLVQLLARTTRRALRPKGRALIRVGA